MHDQRFDYWPPLTGMQMDVIRARAHRKNERGCIVHEGAQPPLDANARLVRFLAAYVRREVASPHGS